MEPQRAQRSQRKKGDGSKEDRSVSHEEHEGHEGRTDDGDTASACYCGGISNSVSDALAKQQRSGIAFYAVGVMQRSPGLAAQRTTLGEAPKNSVNPARVPQARSGSRRGQTKRQLARGEARLL